MNIKEYWLFKAAHVLIEKYGYQLIDVRPIQEEIWLNNPKKEAYGLVRLSLASGFNIQSIEERTHKIREAIEQVMSSQPTFWDVQIDDEGTLEEINPDGMHCVISPDALDNGFVQQFPELKDAFVKVEDPNQELEEIKEKIKAMRKSNKPMTLMDQVKSLPRGTMIITAIIISITILLMGIQFLGYDVFAAAIFMGAYYKTFVLANNEYWRLLTTGFIHIDIFHVLMNSIALINIGSFIERLYGTKRFLIILINGIFFGTFFVFAAEGNNLVVGISGGLYALLGVMLVYLYESGLMRQPMIRSQIMRMVFINVLINFIPQVSVLGHMGGLIVGILLGFMLSRKPSWAPLRKHGYLALIVLSMAVVTLAAQNKNYLPLYGKTDQWVLDIAEDVGLKGYSEMMEDKLFDYYQEVER